MNKELISAVLFGKDLTRDNYVIVNRIGEITYVSFNKLSSKELEDLARIKKILEEKNRKELQKLIIELV
jgi:hypothetical protein